jgi:hypothetical protein
MQNAGLPESYPRFAALPAPDADEDVLSKASQDRRPLALRGWDELGEAVCR